MGPYVVAAGGVVLQLVGNNKVPVQILLGLQESVRAGLVLVQVGVPIRSLNDDAFDPEAGKPEAF